MGRPTLKICGVTRPADAAAAARLGVDCLGLNFCPSSPRCLTPERAGEIIAAAPKLRHIAVLVRPTEAELERLALLRLFALQLYEAEALLDSPALRRLGLPIVPAAGVAGEEDFRALERTAQQLEEAGHHVWRLLVDAKVPGQHGGTGRQAPWSLLAALRPRREFFLAGGLSPANVAEALRVVQPWGVDVASGVESAPGAKDHDKMRRFVEAAAAG